MEASLALLEATLCDEVAVYSMLVGRLPFKLALIRKNRIEQLERLTSQEEADLKRIADRERDRVRYVADLLAQLPPGLEPTLSALLPHLSSEWRERLAPLSDRLIELVRALREGHETASILLRASLEFIDASLQIVARAAANAQTEVYGGTVPTGLHPPSLLLDWRA